MRLHWFIPAVLLLLTACGGEPDQPEVRLRAAIGAAEQAVEARSLKQASGYIAADYQDDRGYNARALRQLLFGYLQRHRDIHLLTRITELQLAADGKSAQVRLYVAMAGVPIPSLEAAAQLRADLYRFDMHFIDGEDGWQVQRAQWRRAELDDLLD
jgi:hypothetical protein